MLLLETSEAVRRFDEIVADRGDRRDPPGVDDLALNLGPSYRSEGLTGETAAQVAETTAQAGLGFGAGGLGRVGDHSLPIPADLIYAQHARLAASAAPISCSFLAPDPGQVDLVAEVARTRRWLADWALRPVDQPRPPASSSGSAR